MALLGGVALLEEVYLWVGFEVLEVQAGASGSLSFPTVWIQMWNSQLLL